MALRPRVQLHHDLRHPGRRHRVTSPRLLDNPVVITGDLVLLEMGGVDIVIVEEDTDGTSGVEAEEAL